MNFYITKSAISKTLRLVMADSTLTSVKAVSGNLEPEAVSLLEGFKITHQVGLNVTTLCKSVDVDSAIKMMRDNLLATSELDRDVGDALEILNVAKADLEFLIEIRAKRPEVFPSTKLYP